MTPTKESFEVWQARRKQERLNAKLQKRKESFNELKKEMISVMYEDIDIDSTIDRAQTLIIEKKIKLTNEEIVSFSSAFFNSGHKTQDRLRNADRLYQELDHANNMIVETEASTVGMFYQ